MKKYFSCILLVNSFFCLSFGMYSYSLESLSLRSNSMEFCQDIHITECDLSDIRMQIPLTAAYLAGMYCCENIETLEPAVFTIFDDLAKKSEQPGHTGLTEIYRDYVLWQDEVIKRIKMSVLESADTIDVPAFVVRGYDIVPVYTLHVQSAIAGLFSRFGSR